jgi:hypothetical protein
VGFTGSGWGSFEDGGLDHNYLSKEPSLPVLTREEDIGAHPLYRRGSTISAIARHLGRDRKTIRASP